MASFSSTQHDSPLAKLTKLYNDAVQSYSSAFPELDGEDSPEILALHRRVQTQKTRLEAWGQQWGSNAEDAQGNIDESVNQAGLSLVVESVLEQIKVTLEEVEKVALRSLPPPPPAAYPLDKVTLRSTGTPRWDLSERSRYEGLVKELTDSIDLLDDISRSSSKSGLAAVDVPPAFQQEQVYENIRDERHTDAEKDRFIPPIKTSRIDPSFLVLPQEGPPPYDEFGVPRAVRVTGRLLTNGISNTRSDSDGISILIEYAGFDAVFREIDAPLPLERLEKLFEAMGPAEARPEKCISNLIGWFEDPRQARVGLVWELQSMRQEFPSARVRDPVVQPSSLLQILQLSSNLHSNPNTSVSMILPTLESRYRLALELVSGLSHLHERGFHHRDIASSSIIVITKAEASSNTLTSTELSSTIRHPILSSFDLFSEYNSESPAEFLHRNIYRHPNDPRVKGPSCSDTFHPEYDLYSLGLVLLEIGLWSPLAEFFKEKYSLKDFRTRIDKIWVKRLAGKCGTPYERVVRDCLAAGDRAGQNHDLLRQVYARNLQRLERCCQLDDEEDNYENDAPMLDTPAVTSPMALEKPIPWHDDATRRSSTMQRSRDEKPRQPKFNLVLKDTPAPTRAEIPYMDSGLEKRLAASLTDSETAPRAPKRKRFEFPEKTLAPEVLTEFEIVGSRLAKIVNKALKESKESASIDVVASGETEATARPTLVVMCNSTKRVQSVLKKNFTYDRNMFDLVVIKVESLIPRSAHEAVTGKPRIRITTKDRWPVHRLAHGKMIAIWSRSRSAVSSTSMAWRTA
ncbi:hypothetical protein MRB53_039294 [Persea americana]|nr:hypothetical protein MRB53_039294 [Persea americana]